MRTVKQRVDRILAEMIDTFAAANHQVARPGIPLERILKALLLMGLYTVRSERQQIDTDLLFRQFLDMDTEEDNFDHSAISKTRDHFEGYGIVGVFSDAVLREAMDAELTSDDHFSIDGTMTESMASINSFRPIDDKTTTSRPETHSNPAIQTWTAMERNAAIKPITAARIPRLDQYLKANTRPVFECSHVRRHLGIL